MAWKTCILDLLLLHVWLYSYASFGENVNCWWNEIQTMGQNVHIECQALPSLSMQKCPCSLQLLLEQPVQTTLHHCSRDTTRFTSAVKLQAMQNVSCTLTCRGQEPAVCAVKNSFPPPTCIIPLDDGERNINCSWPHSLLNPMDFTLYLENMSGKSVGGSPLEMGGNNSVLIQRVEYMTFSDLKAWLSASNAFGSVQSDMVTFNTHTIEEPPAPYIIGHVPEPLEILWEAETAADLPAQWLCKVQYRQLCDPDWTEDEANHEASFVLENPVPFTTYTFRVRCWSTSLEENYVVMSDWSDEYTAKTTTTAPLGKIDVWSVCEPSSEVPSCTILWKGMPAAQVQDGYVVRARLHNGSDLNWRVDAADHTADETCMRCMTAMDGKGLENDTSHAPQTCDHEQRCFWHIHLKVPITEVKGVWVAAYAEHGELRLSPVALPRTNVRTPEVKMEVRGVSRELSVSWSVPSWFSERVQQYVVQHKPIEVPHILCLNWIKVHKTQNSILVRGTLWNYTAYNVSLFAVVSNCSHLLGSHIAYTVQKVPPKITDLQIKDISSSSVILTWTPIPLDKSPALILYYMVGLDNISVANVTRDKSSVQLRELKPGRPYEVWVSAVTEAGQGKKATTTFTTTSDNITFIVVIVIFTLFTIFLIFLAVWCYSSLQQFSIHHRIPDPINSTLFQGENIQAWVRHSWPGTYTLVEHRLTITNVEVVMASGRSREPQLECRQIAELPEEEHHQPPQPEAEPEPEVGGGQEWRESQGFERTDSAVLHRSKDYSQVIDSEDEQRSREDEEWDEQPYPSDYERHFLPCI